MTEETRPVHAIYDCALGKQTEVPYSDEEWEEKKKFDAGNLAALNAERKQAEDDAATMAEEASKNPAYAALARRMGVNLS